MILAVPAILGAILGAQIAVNLNEQIMRQVIGALMVVMFVIILVKPARWLEDRADEQIKKFGIGQFIIFFAIGAYGGFIQAGVGIFLLVGLVLGMGF